MTQFKTIFGTAKSSATSHVLHTDRDLDIRVNIENKVSEEPY